MMYIKHSHGIQKKFLWKQTKNFNKDKDSGRLDTIILNNMKSVLKTLISHWFLLYPSMQW